MVTLLNQLTSHISRPLSLEYLSKLPLTQRPVDVVDDGSGSEYRFEQTRLDSFRNWPAPFINPRDLAAAGFYYTGYIDRVKCFECSTEICRWEEGDQPLTEHQRWGARCRFVRKMPCGNVPIGVDPDSVPLPRPRSFDICGPYGIEYRLDAQPDTKPTADNLACLGIGIPRKPDYPDYATLDARLKSFANWPEYLMPTKEQLANAGFFYTTTGDRTTCYHCGGGLKDWQPTDDPWVEHAKWFPKCFYLGMVKGQTFINNVTGKNLVPPSEKELKEMNLPSYIHKVEPLEEPSSPTSSTGSQGSLGSEPPVQKKDEDSRLCKVCYDEELGVVFLPCGHIATCVNCASSIRNCTICRKAVTMTVRAFLS